MKISRQPTLRMLEDQIIFKPGLPQLLLLPQIFLQPAQLLLLRYLDLHILHEVRSLSQHLHLLAAKGFRLLLVHTAPLMYLLHLLQVVLCLHVLKSLFLALLLSPC